jgi:hypothetical protein
MLILMNVRLPTRDDIHRAFLEGEDTLPDERQIHGAAVEYVGSYEFFIFIIDILSKIQEV